MEKDEFEATIKEMFAAGGRPAIRKAMLKQPLQFMRLMASIAPKPHGAPQQPSEEETDLKVVEILRALGDQRLARLLARAREPLKER